MKKHYIIILVSIILTVLGLLYIERCKVNSGLMNFCLFDNTRGLPLPFYGLDNISFTFLFIDFIFWLLITYLIYFLIFYLIKLLKFLFKK
jgi:hypothetical protein